MEINTNIILMKKIILIQDKSRTSLVAQMVKTACNADDLGEDPLGKGMATHCSILVGKIPWAEEPGELQSMGLQRARHD